MTTTRNIKGVGKTTRAILAEHGIFSVEELANADIDQLIKIPGFGKSKATRMVRAAKYMAGEGAPNSGVSEAIQLASTAEGGVDLTQGELYINQELSLLEFNRRVLEQAKDERTPLLERLNFLCISCSNLDEFFEVRAAGLIQRAELGATRTEPDNLTPQETLAAICQRAHALVAEQYRVLNEVMLPQLNAEGIRFVRRADWTEQQQAWLQDFFSEQLLPILSPIGLDPAHPFPRILNKSLNFIIELSGKDAFGREIEHGIQFTPAEGMPFRRSLHLNEGACLIHHHVHVGFGIAILAIVEIQHRHSLADSHGNRGNLAMDRIGFQSSRLHQVLNCEIERHKSACD